MVNFRISGNSIKPQKNQYLNKTNEKKMFK